MSKSKSMLNKTCWGVFASTRASLYIIQSTVPPFRVPIKAAVVSENNSLKMNKLWASRQVQIMAGTGVANRITQACFPI